MRTQMPLRQAVLAATLASAILGVPGSARAAGLFDAIGSMFGGGEAEAPRAYRPAPGGFYERQGGLDVTVRPRRQKPRRERPVVRRQQQPVAPSAVLNFDPATNPTWYLDDPTLRAGDIVVIKGEVLVFQGGGAAPHAREDFTSLADSKLSREERERIGQMARLPAESSEAGEAHHKTATAAFE